MKQDSHFQRKINLKKTDVGTIPADWDVVKINQIKSNNKYAIAMGPFGSNITKDNFIPSGIPVIRGTNLEDFKFKEEDFVYLSEAKADELKASNAFPKDIVITHRGTLGQVGIIPENSNYSRYVVSQSQMKLSCDENIVNPYFVYYFLKSKRGQHLLLLNKSQTGVPAIARPTASLKGIKIPLPNLEEQNAIVDILKSLDDKIELNRRMNATLEQIAQAIFKQWFIDFEFPDENGQPYKSSGGEMVESELGEIPRGWEVKELKDVCSKICNGGTPARKKKEYWENGTIPWIKTKELCDTIILNSEEKITQEGLDNSAAKLLGPNTVIIAIYASPTVGRLGVVGTHAATNQACTALIADESQYSHYHIFYSLLFLRDHLNNLASGSAQQNISKSIIEKQNILLPPKELLDKSTIGFSNIWKLIENNLWEINYLTQLRDSLLPKLMSGNLRCGVVKRMLEGKT